MQNDSLTVNTLARRSSDARPNIRIAAQAMQHGLTVVSCDQHFRAIDGLRVEAWQGVVTCHSPFGLLPLLFRWILLT
jgi:hypothetical protein